MPAKEFRIGFHAIAVQRRIFGGVNPVGAGLDGLSRDIADPVAEYDGAQGSVKIRGDFSRGSHRLPGDGVSLSVLLLDPHEYVTGHLIRST